MNILLVLLLRYVSFLQSETPKTVANSQQCECVSIRVRKKIAIEGGRNSYIPAILAIIKMFV